jgi:hypothetical protein
LVGVSSARARANFWQVLYTLKTVEQSNVATRLGYKSVFNAKHPSMHYRLETANPEHLAVMEQLCAMAGVNEYLKNLHNVCIDGKLVQVGVVNQMSRHVSSSGRLDRTSSEPAFGRIRIGRKNAQGTLRGAHMTVAFGAQIPGLRSSI